MQGKVRQCRSCRAAPSRCARLLSDAGGYERLRDVKASAGALFTILMGDISKFSVDRFREKIKLYDG